MTDQRVHLVTHWEAERTACGRSTVDYRTIRRMKVTCITCRGTHLYFDLAYKEDTVQLRDGSHQRILVDA